MTDKERNEILLDALIKMGVDEALENEIKAIPPVEELRETYKTSAALDARIAEIIKKDCRKHRVMRIRKRVAAIAAVVIFFVAGSLLSVEATRNAMFNTVLEWRDKYIQIQFTEDSQKDIYRPSFLPAGFTEISESRFENIVILNYDGGSLGKVIFKQYPAETSSSLVNNEDASYEETSVNGAQAFFLQPDDTDLYKILLWQSNRVTFELNATVDRDVMIQIAKSVK